MPELKRLQDITDIIIKETAGHYRQDKPRQFVKKNAETLFEDVLRRIENISEKTFDITGQYKGELFAYIQVQAIAGYQKMHDNFMKTNSPQAILERQKEVFKVRFDFLMGREDMAVHISKTILKNMVLENIIPKLSCSQLLNDLRKAKVDIYTDTASLNRKITTDLLQMKDFKSYNDYVTDYEQFVLEYLDKESRKYFLGEGRLNVLMKEQAKRNIQIIMDAVKETVDNPSDDMRFIKTLFGNIKGMHKSQNSAAAMEDLDVPNAEKFGQHICDTLDNFVRCEVLYSVDRFRNDILSDLKFSEFCFGEIVKCTEKCPFCNAPCDVHSEVSNSGNHAASFHRPAGMRGKKTRGFWFFKHSKLFAENCNALVASNHGYKTGETVLKIGTVKTFKDYRDDYPTWDIAPNADSNSGKYWKWVLATFNDKFAKQYDSEGADIPDAWKSYDTADIIKELK